MPVSAEGTHTLTVVASDAAGNATTKSVTFSIDLTPPVVEITGVIANHFYAATVTPVVTITDATASTLTLDGVAYASGMPVSAEGTHTLTVVASDAVGNITMRSVTFTIDLTPPAGSFLFLSGSSLTSIPVAGVVSQVSDAVGMRIGVDDVWGEWGAYSESTETALPNGDATYTVRAQYRDMAGNVLPLARDIRLDREGPAVTNLHSMSHANGPAWGPVAVVWDQGIDIAGVDGYSAVIDTNPDGDAPLTLNMETTGTTLPMPMPAGQWYVHARAVDGLGNWGPTTTLSVVSIGDSLAPQVSASGIPTSPVNTDVTFSLSATDTVSGVAAILYRLDGGTETTYTVPVVVASEATHTLSYRAIDRANNSRDWPEVTFQIDRHGPVIASITFKPGAKWVTASWACLPNTSDDLVGYSFVTTQSAVCTPSADTMKSSTVATFTATGGGWYVHVRARDSAGNWGPVKSVRYDRAAVSLSRPVAVRRAIKQGRATYQVSGSIVASAAPGQRSPPFLSGDVTLIVERLDSRTWRQVQFATPDVRLAVTSTGATYRATLALVNLPSRSPQTWRVRAWYPGNGDYLPGVSSPSINLRVR